MEEFIERIRINNVKPFKDLGIHPESHLMGFAAGESRLEKEKLNCINVKVLFTLFQFHPTLRTKVRTFINFFK